MNDVIHDTRPNLTFYDIEHFSHDELKQVKTGQIHSLNLDGKKFEVTWSEKNQEFDAVESKSFCAAICNLCVSSCSSNQDSVELAASVAQKLQACQQQDESRRRAEQRDPTSGALYHLIDDSPNPQQASLSIINAGQEISFIPGSASNLPPAPPVMAPPRVLLYGLADNRKNLAIHVMEQFNLQERAVIETIDDYNACLNIPSNPQRGLDFLEYCKIYEQAKNRELEQRINPALSTEETIRSLANSFSPPKPTAGCNATVAAATESKVREWARHLEKNADRLDFSRKLDPAKKDEDILRFIIKNCTSQELSLLNDPNNPHLAEFVTGDAYVLDQASINHLLENLKPVITCLTSRKESDYHQCTKEQKNIADTVGRNAFFRQTSKLGLSFAQETGAMILFSWQGDKNADLQTPAALREQLNAKPYRFDPPASRDEGLHELVTYSEMRQVGRLLVKFANQAQSPNSSQVAKLDYMLVSGQKK